MIKISLPTALLLAYFERFNSPSFSPFDKGPNMGVKAVLIVAVLSLIIAMLTWGKF